ncbi:hypothetical protein WI94_07030 [Burkholderia vietnamiensis]|nr:hypothetical protein WI94_07030 [Burkholderia vietnamiensis]KVE84011.1 hypothetical protein WJ00_00905 [Burkholderia vietnamiensis]
MRLGSAGRAVGMSGRTCDFTFGTAAAQAARAGRAGEIKESPIGRRAGRWPWAASACVSSIDGDLWYVVV